jgi:hypothetical protein
MMVVKRATTQPKLQAVQGKVALTGVEVPNDLRWESAPFVISGPIDA